MDTNLLESEALKRGVPLSWGYRNLVGPALQHEAAENERQRIRYQEDRIVEAITISTLELTEVGRHRVDIDLEMDTIRERIAATGQRNVLRYLVSLMPVTWKGRRLNQHTVLEWNEDGIWQFKIDVRDWQWRRLYVTCLGRKPEPGESRAITHNTHTRRCSCPKHRVRRKNRKTK